MCRGKFTTWTTSFAVTVVCHLHHLVSQMSSDHVLNNSGICTVGNILLSYAPPSMNDSVATVQGVCSLGNVKCSQVVPWWMTSCPRLMKTRMHRCNHIYEFKWKSITFCSHHQNNQCLAHTYGLCVIKTGLLLQVTGQQTWANKKRNNIRQAKWVKIGQKIKWENNRRGQR